MGDTDDGSSNAAHSAPGETTEPPQPDPAENGFFRRIMSALSPSDTGDAADPATTPAQAVAAMPGLLNLRRMTVEDVMIPKAEIVAVATTITRDDLVEVFRDSGMTRLPVYEETLDTPLGMVHLKDFALQYGFNGAASEQIDLKKMLRPLLFVPPSMPIGVLLTKMQTERRHMALVIDEYGGVDGLATIEDLIEQVVGEIEDEHDLEEDNYFTRESPGCYSAQAKTPLDEFETEIGLSLTDAEDIDEEEIDTLGGLVFMLSGRVPVRGEVVQHPNGTEFEVTDADPRRIKRLRVRLPDHSAASDG
ncbi:HlyC/CorC family transporter [Aquicoccus porphyridii]|uniref:HlyC/CorC family transporter n=1 Tax=Aquicoccus porphyridii TaxID=1852029 RepID=A0A5A9ZTF3_9RHOB|nr:hemolysin family protein [Aquicoccus porphyridii]KAA0920409.1 HlyC/CorC family transporter [Aquicoccus porphyridii]RAI54805.1 magnesium/cobalt efflux protein [Rhodobacteraceae bacterium AsT-22]